MANIHLNNVNGYYCADRSEGMVIMKRNKLIYGVGVNDTDYLLDPIVDGKRRACPFYRIWKAMLGRCYSEKSPISRPTYNGCSVAGEWLTFSNFRGWMIKQEWQGMQLDKDILKEGNKVYGPDTCAFVDHRTNSLLNENKLQRGLLPTGVHRLKDTNVFAASCKDGANSAAHIGVFNTPKSARKEYLNVKSKIVIKVALTQPDRRVFLALLGRSVDMRNEMKSIQEQA